MIKLISLFMVMAVMGACATLGGLSPKKQYLVARMEFNTLQTQYLDYYDKATPVLQAKWKATVDPLFAKAEVALDGWGIAVKDGITGGTSQKQFLDLKNQLIDMMAEVFIKEVK